MKIRAVFVLLLLLITINACKKPSEIVGPASSYPTILTSVHGRVFAIPNHDTLFVDSAHIYIDGIERCVTDAQGWFVLDTISQGRHIITVNRTNFIAYSNEDSILRSDSVLHFRLEVRVVDFFPITVGNKWNFNYATHRTFSPTIDDTTFTGGLTWQITQRSVNIDTTYLVMQILEGIGSYRNWVYPERNHSTAFGPDTSYFQIIQSSLGLTRMISNVLGFAFSANRFYWAGYETVSFRQDGIFPGELVVFRRNAGLDHWGYNCGCNHAISFDLTREY